MFPFIDGRILHQPVEQKKEQSLVDFSSQKLVWTSSRRAEYD
jgi:hypothetical protein